MLDGIVPEPRGHDAARASAASPCPRCGGRLFRDAEGSYCIACGFHEPAESGQGIVAYVLAGGAGTRLGLLSNTRAKPALPFGGRHRLIDFTLANCANSGIEHVAVLGRHNWPSVHAVLEVNARPESPQHGRLPRDLRMAVALDDEYSGTASAVRRTLNFVNRAAAQSVLVLAADHVYTMDYRHLLAAHEARRADVTIAVTRVNEEEATRFGIVDLDPYGRVRSFVEKPERPRSTLASMGVCVFSSGALERLLERDAADPASTHDFGRDVIPRALHEGLNVGAYEFAGYWRDIGTVDAYWMASMELLRGECPTDTATWPLIPRADCAGTPRTGPGAVLENALLAGDCDVNAAVRRSIVFPGARIERGASVIDSVILPGAVIGPDALVRRAIIDERAVVGAGASVGAALAGISVVGADTLVPPGFVAARDVMAGGRVRHELAHRAGSPAPARAPATGRATAVRAVRATPRQAVV